MIHADMENGRSDVCEDCGAVVLEGKAGCQKLFEAVVARELGDYRYGKTHRLTVDAYSLQHPEPYMRSGKSFAAHLTGVCAALEYTVLENKRSGRPPEDTCCAGPYRHANERSRPFGKRNPLVQPVEADLAGG